MQPYLPYAMGDAKASPMPLYVKPKAPLSVEDVQRMMRDHYEGTPLAIEDGLGAGAWQMPYRPTPLRFEVDGKAYFNERPISTQQSANVYVSQMRRSMPDHVGGVVWFANDDANMAPFTPVYCSSLSVPECYAQSTANCFQFSFNSAYWVQNWVSNMAYLRYNLLFPEVERVRDRLEADYRSLQDSTEAQALRMKPDEARRFLTDYSSRAAQNMLYEWNQLAQYIIVRNNDMAVKRMDEQGRYEQTPGGNQRPVLRPGYPEEFRRRIVEKEGERYRMPD